METSGKITFWDMFGICCQTRRNIFTFSCKRNNAFTCEMNHAGSPSYHHISGNVRKMISGVVDNFLFQLVNTRSPLFSIRHFQMYFLEWEWISIKISLIFVLEGPINSIPTLIPIMVWCQSGDKPLSEWMMAEFIDAYMRHSVSVTLEFKLVDNNSTPVFDHCKDISRNIYQVFIFFRRQLVEFGGFRVNESCRAVCLTQGWGQFWN